jgi:hypothetical protein
VRRVTINTTQFAIYRRAASEPSAISLDHQLKVCEAYIASQQGVTAGVFHDVGHSTFGFDTLIATLGRGEAAHVVISTPSRLHRSSPLWQDRHGRIQATGATLHIADGTDPEQLVMLTSVSESASARPS